MRAKSSIWALAFPIILSNITVPMLGAVDSAVMGHMESAAYLGAVAIGALIFNYIYWGFGFLRQATTGLAAQAVGAQDGDEARAIFGRAVLIALIGAVLIWVNQGWIFSLAGYLLEASDEVETLARSYYEIRIWSAPADLLNYALIGWIIAQKDTKGVLIQQVFTNVVNIVLNLWFVIGLGWGVEGVAFATLIAQYAGLCVGLLILKKNLSSLEGKWHFQIIFDMVKIKRFMSMNMDILVRTICLLTAFAWFTSQGAKMGDVTLAANAILMQFLYFTSYALDGFAHAVEVLAGHGAGKKDQKAFRQAVKDSTRLALACALAFTIVFAVFGDWLIGLFSDIEEVVMTAQAYMIWMIIMPVIAVWSFLIDGIYFGLTQTRPLRNMMVLSLAFYIPTGMYLVSVFGNHGLWAAFTLFMGLRAITLIMKFFDVEKKAFA